MLDVLVQLGATEPAGEGKAAAAGGATGGAFSKGLHPPTLSAEEASTLEVVPVAMRAICGLR